MSGHKIIEGLDDAIAFINGDGSRGKIVPFPVRKSAKPFETSCDLRPVDDPEGRLCAFIRRIFAADQNRIPTTASPEIELYWNKRVQRESGLPCDVEPEDCA